MSRWLRVRVVVDRVLAALLLVVFAPVIGACGWMVRRHDGGPSLIAVPRVGRGGRTIGMWKLRTMRVETADGRAGGVGLTAGQDSRITPVGVRLRAWYLDELPQLYNVVRGEMCLLGPRPEDPEFVTLDDQRWRDVLAAPPGIAGPTQLVVGDWERDLISAAPDGGRYRNEVVPVKLAIDGWYVSSASPRIDALVVTSFVRSLLGASVDRLTARVAIAVPTSSRVRT